VLEDKKVAHLPFSRSGFIGEKSRKKDKWHLNANVYITSKILNSKAFNELSGSGIKALLRFMQKRKWKVEKKGRKKVIIYDLHGLVFTYAEARSILNISDRQFLNILNKLVEIGFLDIEHQGGAYGHDYSRYALSERWQLYGTSSFKTMEKKRRLALGLDVYSRIEAKKAISENEGGKPQSDTMQK